MLKFEFYRFQIYLLNYVKFSNGFDLSNKGSFKQICKKKPISSFQECLYMNTSCLAQ